LTAGQDGVEHRLDIGLLSADDAQDVVAVCVSIAVVTPGCSSGARWRWRPAGEVGASLDDLNRPQQEWGWNREAKRLRGPLRTAA